MILKPKIAKSAAPKKTLISNLTLPKCDNSVAPKTNLQNNPTMSNFDKIPDTYSPIDYCISDYNAANLIVDITRENKEPSLPYLNISVNDKTLLHIPCNAIPPLIKALRQLHYIASDKGLYNEFKK